MLIKVSNLLDKYKVKHCLMFGTLLGAYRNNTLIEKDDLDLGIYEQFWKDDRLWNHFNLDLNDDGLYVEDMAYNYICIKGIDSSWHVDMYLLLKDEKEYTIKVTGVVAHFPHSDFDELTSYKFLGKDFLIPKDIEGHLERNYGSDWRTPSHSDNWNSRTPINNYKKIKYTYIVSRGNFE